MQEALHLSLLLIDSLISQFQNMFNDVVSLLIYRLFQKTLCRSMISCGVQLVELDLSDNAFGPIGAEGIQVELQSLCLLRSPISTGTLICDCGGRTLCVLCAYSVLM